MRKSFPDRWGKQAIACYSLALVATLLMLAIRRALDPVLGRYVPYLLVFPAIAFSSRYCGVGPTILTTVLGFLGEQYWFIPPLHTFTVTGGLERANAVAYFSVSAVVIAFAESGRRTLARLAVSKRMLEQAGEALRMSHEQLEQRVEERTREIRATNLELTNQAAVVRELSGRLLHIQDEERRRLARDLHDSLGQIAAALGMNLFSLQDGTRQLSYNQMKALDESLALTEELSKQIRTISHLLHPPLLDEVGLPAALRFYVEEFARRSNVPVTLELSPDLGRLSREVETSIFRMIQEGLTNIHRHSGSPTAAIRVTRADGYVRAEIEDAGRGMSPEKQILLTTLGRAGGGIRGMRERLRQFGGTLEVRSNDNGTLVTASIPEDRAAAASDSDEIDGSQIATRLTDFDEHNARGTVERYHEFR
jgi:signal transduction histidine kinase